MAELLEQVRSSLMGRSSVERQLDVGREVTVYVVSAKRQSRRVALTIFGSRFSGGAS